MINFLFNTQDEDNSKSCESENASATTNKQRTNSNLLIFRVLLIIFQRCMHNFIQHRRGVVLDIYNAKCSCIEEVNKLKGTAVISGDFVEWFYYSEDRHNKEK